MCVFMIVHQDGAEDVRARVFGHPCVGAHGVLEMGQRPMFVNDRHLGPFSSMQTHRRARARAPPRFADQLRASFAWAVW